MREARVTQRVAESSESFPPLEKKKGDGWWRRRRSTGEGTVHPRFHFSNISTFLIIDEAFFVHPSRTLWPRAKITRDSNGFRRLFPWITIDRSCIILRLRLRTMVRKIAITIFQNFPFPFSPIFDGDGGRKSCRSVNESLGQIKVGGSGSSVCAKFERCRQRRRGDRRRGRC